MPRRTLAKVEIVVYNGITFRRYPESKNYSDRSYYRPNSVHIKHGVQALHREIWRHERGAIPNGYDVHHIDGNTSNNNVSNLECIPESEHHAIHTALISDERKEELRQWADKIRPLTKEWHASDEGRDWHRQHALESGFGIRNPTDRSCDQCGKIYTTFNEDNARFCSNNCKSAYRRASGVDNIALRCSWCNVEFQCNKYAKKECCSPSCARRLSWQRRKSQ